MTTSAYPRGVSAGGKSGLTKAGAIFALRGSFDPTSSSQVSLGVIPKNAVVVDVISYGGATGGTNPTVDIGTSDEDGLANELDADGVSSAVAAGTAGALINTVLSSDTTVYGKVGGSAATGGTTSVAVLYTVTD